MKIMHVIPNLGYGGAEKICIDLCNYMAEQRHQVILCTLCDHDPSMRSIGSVHKDIYLISMGKKGGFSIRQFFKIFKLIKDTKPDIINAHMVGLFYLLFVVLKRKNRIFYTVHSTARNDATFYYRPFYKIFFKFFKVIPIAVSDSVLVTVKQTYKVSNAITITNGIAFPKESDKINIAEKEILRLAVMPPDTIFICLARIHRTKRIELLLKSFDKF